MGKLGRSCCLGGVHLLGSYLLWVYVHYLGHLSVVGSRRHGVGGCLRDKIGLLGHLLGVLLAWDKGIWEALNALARLSEHLWLLSMGRVLLLGDMVLRGWVHVGVRPRIIWIRRHLY